MEQQQDLSLTLPVRQLVEFLLRRGSIDNRFTGFDRANEGARLHRKLQRAATAEHQQHGQSLYHHPSQQKGHQCPLLGSWFYDVSAFPNSTNHR